MDPVPRNRRPNGPLQGAANIRRTVQVRLIRLVRGCGACVCLSVYGDSRVG